MGLLWFRRSRGKDTKPEPEVQVEAPRFQQRVPLKLRGLLLLKLEPGDGLDQIEQAPPLGPREDVIRQRFRVKRQIRVVTAHARLTGWVLTGMPVAVAIAMLVVAPDHILTLIRDPLGIQMALAAVGLWVVGYLAIRQLVNVEY